MTFAGGKARYDAKGRHFILTPTARLPATAAAPPLAQAVSRRRRIAVAQPVLRMPAATPAMVTMSALFHPRIGLLLLP